MRTVVPRLAPPARGAHKHPGRNPSIIIVIIIIWHYSDAAVDDYGPTRRERLRCAHGTGTHCILERPPRRPASAPTAAAAGRACWNSRWCRTRGGHDIRCPSIACARLFFRHRNMAAPPCRHPFCPNVTARGQQSTNRPTDARQLHLVRYRNLNHEQYSKGYYTIAHVAISRSREAKHTWRDL